MNRSGVNIRALVACLCFASLLPTLANAEDNAAVSTKQQHNRERFIEAFRQFQNASGDLGQAVALKKDLKAPAMKIDESTKVFLDVLKSKSKNRATFSPAELKNHKVQELAWEALTTADRVTPYLAAVIEQDASIPGLEAELLRLQWIVRHLK